MRELQTLRKINQREIARQSGRHPRSPLISQTQAQMGFIEADIAAMPLNVDQNSPLQNASGQFYFLVGISRVGGSDPIAP